MATRAPDRGGDTRLSKVPYGCRLVGYYHTAPCPLDQAEGHPSTLQLRRDRQPPRSGGRPARPSIPLRWLSNRRRIRTRRAGVSAQRAGRRPKLPASRRAAAANSQSAPDLPAVASCPCARARDRRVRVCHGHDTRDPDRLRLWRRPDAGGRKPRASLLACSRSRLAGARRRWGHGIGSAASLTVRALWIGGQSEEIVRREDCISCRAGVCEGHGGMISAGHRDPSPRCYQK